MHVFAYNNYVKLTTFLPKYVEVGCFKFSFIIVLSPSLPTSLSFISRKREEARKKRGRFGVRKRDGERYCIVYKPKRDEISSPKTSGGQNGSMREKINFQEDHKNK